MVIFAVSMAAFILSFNACEHAANSPTTSQDSEIIISPDVEEASDTDTEDASEQELIADAVELAMFSREHVELIVFNTEGAVVYNQFYE